MSTTRSVEATGATIEEAIQIGLDELQVSRESVIVEILEESSRGILGLGSRLARVRLTTAARPRVELPSEPEPPKAPEKQRRPPAPRHENQEVEEEDDDLGFTSTAISESDLNEDARIGREKLAKLLELMELEAEVIVERSGEGEDSIVVLQIQSEDAGSLIGRKGETLTSLQYLVRLIASHDLQRRVNFVVDAGGYKAKRIETLRKLAIRMADQAVERHRTVRLEPMPPHERRIIHMALRKRSDVTTKSVGEGNFRKVTIIPQHN